MPVDVYSQDGADATFATAAQGAKADTAVQPAALDASLAGKAAGVGVSTIWAGSQAAYDAITTPDPDTLYFVTG